MVDDLGHLAVDHRLPRLFIPAGHDLRQFHTRFQAERRRFLCQIARLLAMKDRFLPVPHTPNPRACVANGQQAESLRFLYNNS